MKSISFFIVLPLFLQFCKPQPIKPELEVIWKLEKNFKAEGHDVHTSSLWLVNRGKQVLSGTDWAIYWNQPPFFVARTESVQSVSLARINGDLYELRPGNGFSLAPGDTLLISYTLAGFIIKESDAPQGMYVTYLMYGEELTERIRNISILPFITLDQLTRSKDDQEPIPAPEFLFDQNAGLAELPESEWYPVLPVPKQYNRSSGQCNLTGTVSFAAQAGLEKESLVLQKELKKQFNIEVTPASGPAKIELSLSDQIKNREGYQLSVDAGCRITITGGSAAGVFYGIQSLLGLIRKQDDGPTINACAIDDEPAVAYRGLHLDVGRNFQRKETILRMLDLLARYKLNKFLLYVTEDEGWRLAIKEFPELTEVGGRRGHRYRDSLYLQPAYGSGPDADDPTSYGNGFYTRADFKEIIRYAYDRHIDVIPEINLPGHARAAIRAMELRYNRLMKEGRREEALRYRLIDPEETSKYLSAQGYNDNVVCVCQDAAYRFFEVALDDIIEMYKEAGVPLTMMHTGGDEVPGKAWSESPVCAEFLKQYPEIKNTRNLQSHFFDRITQIIRSRNLPVGAWEEAVMAYDEQDNWYPNNQFVGREVYPYIWNNLWGNQDLGYKLANAGYPVILCNVTNFYFDLAYNKDPREPGLYWAGFVDTKAAFSFVPYNLFLSTTHDNMGRAFDPEVDFRGMERLTPRGRANIVGVQAQIWSETINQGQDMLEYYMLPKLLGFAQRAWQGQPPWADLFRQSDREAAFQQDWNKFVNTVGFRELPALDSFNDGYHYRIPAPGIRTDENGSVLMNTHYPGFEIRYTDNGSEPDRNSTLYTGPVSLKASTVKAACFNAKGRSGFSTIFQPK